MCVVPFSMLRRRGTVYFSRISFNRAGPLWEVLKTRILFALFPLRGQQVIHRCPVDLHAQFVAVLAAPILWKVELTTSQTWCFGVPSTSFASDFKTSGQPVLLKFSASALVSK
jgi:hypothetical protein